MIRLHSCHGIACRSSVTASWLFVSAVSAWGAGPLGTGFTYQAQVKLNGGLVNNTCDCQFSLWDDQNGGTQIGPTLTYDGFGGNPAPVMISDGVFTVELDFGAGAFQGDERWLQIDIGCPAGGGLVMLSPRQLLTATPYAIRSLLDETFALPFEATIDLPDPLFDLENPNASGTAIVGEAAQGDGLVGMTGSGTGVRAISTGTGDALRAITQGNGLAVNATGLNRAAAFGSTSTTSALPAVTMNSVGPNNTLEVSSAGGA